EKGFQKAGHDISMDSLQPLPWSQAKVAQIPEELPSLIRHCLEESRNIEYDAKSTDEFSLLYTRTAEIMNQLKDSLTASQFEQFEIWRKVNQDNMSRRYEGVYLAGARIGIKFAKECESNV